MFVLLVGYSTWLANGCGPTVVHVEAVSAESLVQRFSGALPQIVAASESEGRAALEHACCERARMEAALATHEAHWAPIVSAWHSAQTAHDAWRLKLMECQETPSDGCALIATQLAGVFATSAQVARCALRSSGHAALDPIHEAVTCGR
jgi:hypothetical protein